MHSRHVSRGGSLGFMNIVHQLRRCCKASFGLCHGVGECRKGVRMVVEERLHVLCSWFAARFEAEITRS